MREISRMLAESWGDWDWVRWVGGSAARPRASEPARLGCYTRLSNGERTGGRFPEPTLSSAWRRSRSPSAPMVSRSIQRTRFASVLASLTAVSATSDGSCKPCKGIAARWGSMAVRSGRRREGAVAGAWRRWVGGWWEGMGV